MHSTLGVGKAKLFRIRKVRKTSIFLRESKATDPYIYNQNPLKINKATKWNYNVINRIKKDHFAINIELKELLRNII